MGKLQTVLETNKSIGQKSKISKILATILGVIGVFVLANVVGVGAYFLGKNAGLKEDTKQSDTKSSDQNTVSDELNLEDLCKNEDAWESGYPKVIIANLDSIILIEGVVDTDKVCSSKIFDAGGDDLNNVHFHPTDNKVSFACNDGSNSSNLTILDIETKATVTTDIFLGFRYQVSYREFPDDVILVFPYEDDFGHHISYEDYFKSSSLKLVSLDGEIYEKSVKDYPTDSNFKLDYTRAGHVIDKHFIVVYTGQDETYVEIDKIDITNKFDENIY